MPGRNIDGVLVQWGERLFYPGNRIVRALPLPSLQVRAALIRKRIATLVRRAPQVIVRATGGGKGMVAIAGHLGYITRNGRLEFEDDRGTTRAGKEAMDDLLDQWRYSGKLIAETSNRRESLHLMLAMPAGTDPQQLRQAVREFARIELAGHRYVMVLHKDQASPHVHLCARLESTTGQRLSHGRGDLKRWRETLADALGRQGIEADATYQSVRGETRNFEPLWRLKAREQGNLKTSMAPTKSGPAFEKTHNDTLKIWANILLALNESERADDRKLLSQLTDFLCHTPYIREVLQKHPQALPMVRRHLEAQQKAPTRERSGPEWSR